MLEGIICHFGFQLLNEGMDGLILPSGEFPPLFLLNILGIIFIGPLLDLLPKPLLEGPKLSLILLWNGDSPHIFKVHRSFVFLFWFLPVGADDVWDLEGGLVDLTQHELPEVFAVF
jgi:hypothetical protein